MELNVYQILGGWMKDVFGPTIKFPSGILSIRQVPPVLGRVFTHRFKIEIATFDGTGNNPHDIRCMVVSIVEDRVSVDNDCGDIPDFN